MILQIELNKLDAILQQKPDIVMTHFIPTAVGIPKKYQAEITNAFFYFNADEFLSKSNQIQFGIVATLTIQAKKSILLKMDFSQKKLIYWYILSATLSKQTKLSV